MFSDVLNRLDRVVGSNALVWGKQAQFPDQQGSNTFPEPNLAPVSTALEPRSPRHYPLEHSRVADFRLTKDATR